MEFKRINKAIILFLFTNFFLFNISWFINVQLLNMKSLFRDTAYSSLNSLVEILSVVFGSVLYTITLLFFVGSIILLFVVFFIDFLNKQNFKELFGKM